MSLIIGIAGGTGSGKSTVAERIRKVFQTGTVTIIRHDDYYHPPTGLSPEKLAMFNYDHPSALQTDLLTAHLNKLKRGESVSIPKYDFAKHERKPLEAWGGPTNPTPIIVVEGILVFEHPGLCQMCDYRLFVDTPADERLARRIMRDTKERGRTYESVIEQWRKTVQPMHLQFCEPSRRTADLIIPEGGENERGLQMLDEMILDLGKRLR